MNWDNIKLVWRREMRDQLRDRRTLFVIGVLPLLIYPMMGIAFSRLSQFVRQNKATIAVVGYEQLADLENVPPLLDGKRFEEELFRQPGMIDTIEVETFADSAENLEVQKQRMNQEQTDLVVYFPSGFAERLEKLRHAMRSEARGDEDQALPDPPNPVVFYDARDESQLAYTRVQGLLDRWQSKIVRNNLIAGRIPIEITRPFSVEAQNISPADQGQMAFWSKLLPFIVFICALTGAFYPAVDLCAGEKERGTLETLLTSPAQRSEIVGGKLLTVITFSIGSALCNLASMAITGQLILKQLNAMSPAGQQPLSAPPLAAIGWLLLALLPMSLLFSALSLALASLARSTKEGQYYLMPLFLVCMPLMALPLMPGIELNLSTSLVPISGMVLLIQAAMESKLAMAATYLVPVVLVTLGCCAVAVRWAVSQFNQESVLFRDTENFDLMTWARYAYAHRPPTPTLAAAALLIALIFLAQFVMQSMPPDLSQPGAFTKLILMSQLGCILLPTLVVAKLTVRSFRRTFLLDRRVPWREVVLGVLLAICLHPVGTTLMEGIVQVFPLPAGFVEMAEQMAGANDGPEISLPYVLLLLAVLPAICEEMAFRGFVLSGLLSRLRPHWAVVVSAVFFGLAHASALQQTISATLLGLVIGYIAVKSRQITPCVAFHMSYNGLQLLRTRFADYLEAQPWADAVFRDSPTPVVGLGFTTPVVILSGLAAIALLWQVGPTMYRSAETYGLKDDASSPLPSAAPAKQTRP
ncbi:ABC transporter permease subunit/CPBP intramembrane protease [Aeoliella sp.]|uniref:ABC transporter permease subunit/CPBP intramembrane protease n=1 Tax=Aeoliella sp. TaxID=2795800 RepID=UPI003CCC234E